MVENFFKTQYVLTLVTNETIHDSLDVECNLSEIKKFDNAT